MQLAIGPHLEESELELYSMGRLPEERIGPFEEHFLACEPCQDRLLEMDAYVNAVRSVSPKLRAAPDRTLWARLTLVATCAAAVLTMLLSGRLPPPRSSEMAVVRLEAMRGAEPARAAAGQAVTLEIDLTRLPPASSYVLEVVDASGALE